MDPTLYQTRNNLKQLYAAAPTPEARLLARQALTRMKTALHFPDLEYERRRLSSLIELFASLSLCARTSGPQHQTDEESAPGQISHLSDYYSQLGTELRTVEGFLDHNRRDPEPTLFLLGAPHPIEESEEIWLALFRAVDLWKVRSDLYKKCADRNGMRRKLHLEAFRWLDEAVHCPRGSGIDPAYWLVGIIARHPTHSVDPLLQQEQRVNLAILRLVVRAILDRLRKAWVAEYHPEIAGTH